MAKPSEPSPHRKQSDDDDAEANYDDKLAKRFIAHGNSYSRDAKAASVGLPPRQVLACRVNHDSALSRGDLFPGRPQPPQQKRVKQRRHPDLELSLSEFENPAHDVKNQRIDRQPARNPRSARSTRDASGQ